jgi:LmbE family N-acetylglucosaminyl deacetylase
MPSRAEFLENSIIIAAHPDDEVLWFNSILRDVDEVIVVFSEFWAHPGLGKARAAALAEFPRPNVSCLNLTESGAYGCASWPAPELDEFGIAFTFEASRRELKRMAKRALPKVGPISHLPVAAENLTRQYRINFSEIVDSLRPRLAAGMNVFTHNPWGEYGHEEHVQLFRALDLLRGEIGFRLWMSNYCTERSLPLAMRYFESAPGNYLRLSTDKAFADEVASVYKRHGCWTWAHDWAWFDEECFMIAPGAPSPAAPHRHLFPLNLFTIEEEQVAGWLSRKVFS